MKKVFLILMVAIGATGSGLNAQESTNRAPADPAAAQTPAAQAAVTPPIGRGDDEQAIKALLDTFVKAFNAGNAEATAATYTETAVVVDERGERVEGRAAVRDQYAASFADNPGSTIAIQVDSLRFLGPETALEEGRTTITPAAGAGARRDHPLHRRIRQARRTVAAGRRARRARARPHPPRPPQGTGMAGRGLDQREPGRSRQYHLQMDRRRQLPGPRVHHEDRRASRCYRARSGSAGTRLSHQFKTWIFDSEGGFGEGYWTRNGDQWVIKAEGVRQDGQHASATNIITRLGKDRVSWQSVDRTIGGAAVPGVDEFTIVRKPPEAGK